MEITKLNIVGDDNYFIKEAFNVLRTNIQFSGADVKSIVITSCGMNEGKTLVALHVGKSLAEIGKKVLVLDADMRKSVMAGKNTDAVNPKGLSEVLTGQITVQAAVYHTQYSNLDLVFSGMYPPNPVKLLDSGAFNRVLEIYSEKYDYIIIDAPPLGLVIDAAVIASRCDSAVFVVGSRDIRAGQAREVVDQLQKSGCSVLGAVLNNVSSKHSGKKYRYKEYR